MELGPFVLDDRLGQGAMGEVWRAEHRDSGVPAAIKVITETYASRADYRRRFRNEIRAAASLNHPGIIRVYDYGEVDRDAAAASGLALRPGSPYFAMELADGGSVDALDAELGWSNLRELLIGLLQALGHAHAREIVHRDLKPSNVLLGRDARGRRRFKISDFGLAFDRDRALDPDQSLDSAVGTPHYMAPEQLRSRLRELGPWTDLYSLGCMTWQVATGEAPFQGDVLLEVARSHLTDPLPDFEPRFAVPDGFERWLARLLERHPHDRFRRAADALWALLELPAAVDEESSAALEVDERPTMARTSVTEPLEALAAAGAGSDREVETPEPRETMAPDHAGDPPRTIEPVERELPPVPSDWAQRRAPGASLPRMTAGRELFSLREVPTVGRQEERDALWEALREVVDEGAARVVVLRGDAGVGKTRLARWLGERAEEVGAARALEASHDPETREGGLAELVGAAVGLEGLDRDEALERAEKWYESRGIDRDYEPRAAVELAVGDGAATAQTPGADDETDDPAPLAFSGDSEVRALVRRTLERAAGERPLVVHLDDLQWGARSLEFLDYLLSSGAADELPVLVVGTVREDLIGRFPTAHEQLAKLEDRAETRTIEIGPMSESDQIFLVEELLHLAPTVAERIAERAAGNPLFAVELVRDWIERDLLEPTDRGFAFADDADPQMPEGLYDVWRARLDELLEETSPEARDALELAAALGEEIDASEWRRACAAAEVPFPTSLVEHLVRGNLLRETDDGWRLAHSLLRETLVRQAKEAGRWADWNEHCAEVLEPDRRDPDELARFAAHLVEAGERAAALEPFLTAAEEFGRSSEMRRVRACFERAAECEDCISFDEHPRLGARFYHVKGRVVGALDSEHDRADELFDRALEFVERTNDWRTHSRILDGKGMIASRQERYEWHLEYAKRARDRCCDMRSTEAVRADYRRAKAHEDVGDFERARQLYRDASATARREDFRGLRRMILGNLSRCLFFDGDFEGARERSRDVLNLAEPDYDNHARARASNMLGNVARKSGDLEEAESWFERAEKFAQLVDAPELFPCYLGKVEIQLQSGRYEAALRSLERVERRVGDRGTNWFRTPTIGLRSAALAGLERWSELEATLDSHAELLSPPLSPVQEAAEYFGEAARWAAASDRTELAARLGGIACDIWSDRDDDAAEALADDLAAEGVDRIS